MTVNVFAPAKINLTLHVTGQREDGYHLLDSYVVFADVGDWVRLRLAAEMSMTVTGPFAEGVPEDDRNLCWQAAELFGENVHIELEKNLPPSSGIGGGSSDAAAVIKAIEKLTGRSAPFDPLVLGADVPVCMVGHAAHMSGIGDVVMPLFSEPDHAVLVNPGVSVSTPEIFSLLANKSNRAMEPWPTKGGQGAAMDWLAHQRNDLEAAACALQPVITETLGAIAGCADVQLTRMSGSGATCFGLFPNAQSASAAAASLSAAHPNWWVKPSVLR